MIKSVCILGRQPHIGLAELESLYGSDVVKSVGRISAGLDIDADNIDFRRLGGSTKLASVLGEIDSTDWKKVEKTLQNLVRSSSFALPTSGKFHLGLSAIGFSISPAKLSALGLTLKKIIRSRNISVRTVPNQTLELSTAQVFHNKLATEQGAEIILIANGNNTIVARTVAVQDIDSYTLRDRGRPKRDARVGMLPPKLAQIIINLGVGRSTNHESNAVDKVKTPITVLDPFCGTGVVLQEAILMGYDAYGTDLEPRMINYTDQNLDWAKETFNLQATIKKTEVGDATTHNWDFQSTKTVVACETYLGRPFTALPDRATLEQTVSDVNLIIKKFMANIHPQLPSGARLCLAVPAWQISPHKFRHLPLIDTLSSQGFERPNFTHVNHDDLIYYRDDQTVGRQLLVLQKK